MDDLQGHRYQKAIFYPCRNSTAYLVRLGPLTFQLSATSGDPLIEKLGTLMIKSEPLDTKFVFISWIDAERGHGTTLLQAFEQFAVREWKCEAIKLVCSLSPLELKETCMRRLNFYIKNQYRVVDMRIGTCDKQVDEVEYPANGLSCGIIQLHMIKLLSQI